MGNGFWSWSSCRPDCQWYGVPGSGCWYWTQRFGQYWVSGGVHVKYGQVAYECGMLGVPVKSYGWISEFSNNGQWFEGGCIVWQFQNGSWQWVVKVGNWGQTGGRTVDEPARAGMSEDGPPADEVAVPAPEPA